MQYIQYINGMFPNSYKVLSYDLSKKRRIINQYDWGIIVKVQSSLFFLSGGFILDTD